MKRVLSILLTAFMVAVVNPAANAQCKYVKESKDAFTGEAVKKASNLALGPWMWTITLEQKGEKYFIGLKIIQGGDIRYTLHEGEKVMIKLENEKIVEVEMQQDYPPVAQVMGASVYTIWVTNTEVDRKLIKRLSRSPITDVKVVIQGIDVVLPKVKDRQANAIMNSAACIIGEEAEPAKS